MSMQKSRCISIAIILLIILSSFIYSCTNGLVVSGGSTYVTELLSSGSDDNIAINISRLLFIPALVNTILRRKKRMGISDYLINVISILAQVVILMTIEVGSIMSTVFRDYNLPLLVWLLSVASFILVQVHQLFYSSKRSVS